MAHLLIAFKRKDGLSLTDFSRHWREVHAPLAKRMPGLRGYVTKPQLDRGEPEPGL